MLYSRGLRVHCGIEIERPIDYAADDLPAIGHLGQNCAVERGRHFGLHLMNLQTGKITYLVIARGGIFGIDEKLVPVPWIDFKITPNVKLLVLDATKGTLEAAPQANKDQFTIPGHFDRLTQKVDAFWKTHLSDKGKD